jgi:hypothetical protein
MTPTVGRIVYYNALDGETYPAIVTKVFNSTTLGLSVFYPLSANAVVYLNGVLQGEDGGTWDWMPYQKMMAEKTEKENDVNKSSAQTE